MKPLINLFTIWPSLLPIIYLFVAMQRLEAQAIQTSISSITSPTGTATAPLYVIDSDANNADPVYTRYTLTCGGVVQFINSAASATTGTYRLSAALKHSDCSTVVGPFNSASQLVTNLAPAASTSRTFLLNIVPATDLGVGSEYTVEYKVQAYVYAGMFGGNQC